MYKHIRCSYKVKGKKGKLSDYSCKFKSELEANNWYLKHGIFLENLFNINLIFVTNE